MLKNHNKFLFCFFGHSKWLCVPLKNQLKLRPKIVATGCTAKVLKNRYNY